MRRSLPELLRQESPIPLAREALWRTRRQWHKKRFLAQIANRNCPVSLRIVPYYNPTPVIGKGSQATITAYANEIHQGRFPFLGYGTRPLGLKPKWNADFVSGMEWPNAPMNNGAGVRLDGADVKVPWELSRLQFLPVLGKAFVLTGDERYREDAKNLLVHWIDNNPAGSGINWAIAMEASLRAMSICFLLSLIAPLRPSERAWLDKVTRSLWHHLLYIESHTEFSYLISSNHYLSNIVGLYCLAEFLDGPGMGARRRTYRQRIESEILRQVYEDGGDYEASIGYHALVTQMFTSSLLLMRACNWVPGTRFLERLRLMHRMLQSLASTTGQLPHIGDCDDGRVELLLDDLQQMLALPVAERNSLRVSNLLGLGKRLFGEGRGSTEDADWYCATRNSAMASPTTLQSNSPSEDVTVFSRSGLALARSGEAEILFLAIPNGIFGKGSHTHNDKLSFILRLHGEEVLCDSGTGCYTRDPELRNKFRATAAHNTVVVDGAEQNAFDAGSTGLFWIGTDAEVTPMNQWRDRGEVHLQASHSGYKRLGVMHTRTIRMARGAPAAIVEDHLGGTGKHHFELNFQLAPGWTVASLEKLGSEIRVRIVATEELVMVVRGPGELHVEQTASHVSMTYGCIISNYRLRVWGESPLPASITTTLTWVPHVTANREKRGGRRMYA